MYRPLQNPTPTSAKSYIPRLLPLPSSRDHPRHFRPYPSHRPGDKYGVVESTLPQLSYVEFDDNEYAARQIRSGDQDGVAEWEMIRSLEREDPGFMDRALTIRERGLSDINPEIIDEALGHFLNAKPYEVPSLAMVDLCQVLHIPLVHHTPRITSTVLIPDTTPVESIVDPEGNPHTPFILAFLDTLLILFRPVSTTPIALTQEGSTENDETDQKAFGALTITSLASKLLILVTHTHDEVLRCLWSALIYLCIGFRGSRRDVAGMFLLERIMVEWNQREERATIWHYGELEDGIDGDWLRRARGFWNIWKDDHRICGLADFYAEMKGLNGEIASGRSRAYQSRMMAIPTHLSPVGIKFERKLFERRAANLPPVNDRWSTSSKRQPQIQPQNMRSLNVDVVRSGHDRLSVSPPVSGGAITAPEPSSKFLPDPTGGTPRGIDNGLRGSQINRHVMIKDILNDQGRQDRVGGRKNKRRLSIGVPPFKKAGIEIKVESEAQRDVDG